MKLMSRIFLLLSITVLMVGCKIEVIVPSGGDVKSDSGTRDCIGGSLCEHNVTDLTFNETFTAVPRPGYVFTKWNKGHGFLCGDSVDPVCKVSLVGIPDGDAAITAMLASGHIFYVMPHFQFVGVDTDRDGIHDHLDEDDDNDGILDGDDGCPLNPNTPCQLITASDTIVASGRVWAQVDLFTNVSWEQISAVCPQGVCAGNALLNGRDMTGWTWATVDDLNALFNLYIGIDVLGPGPDCYGEGHNNPWVDAFFDDGWRDHDFLGGYVSVGGRLRDSADYVAFLVDSFTPGMGSGGDSICTNEAFAGFNDPGTGAWFYRSPDDTPSGDSVIRDGKEWLQPKDFINYSYNQVSAVCPDGVCSGALPGSSFNLTGYTWASMDDFTALFEGYLEEGYPIFADFHYTRLVLPDSEYLEVFLRDPPQVDSEGTRYFIATVDNKTDYTEPSNRFWFSLCWSESHCLQYGHLFWRPFTND